MKYVIRCIFPKPDTSRTDWSPTERGWEVLYGDVGAPLVFDDLNVAYRQVAWNSSIMAYNKNLYLVEEHY